MAHCIVLLGAPGSGKGTQAEKLAKDLKIPHISTGAILRNHPDPKIRAIVNSGKFISDDLIIEIVKERLSNEKKGWILDGYPRTLFQAQFLKAFPVKVFYLKVDDEIVKKRLTLRRTCSNCGAIYHLANRPPIKDSLCDLCGGLLTQRDDDRSEVIAERLKTYYEKTAPLIDYFKKEGNLIEIPSSGSPEETHKIMLQYL